MLLVCSLILFLFSFSHFAYNSHLFFLFLLSYTSDCAAGSFYVVLCLYVAVECLIKTNTPWIPQVVARNEQREIILEHRTERAGDGCAIESKNGTIKISPRAQAKKSAAASRF